jgi:hypothetical protein
VLTERPPLRGNKANDSQLIVTPPPPSGRRKGVARVCISPHHQHQEGSPMLRTSASSSLRECLHTWLGRRARQGPRLKRFVPRVEWLESLEATNLLYNPVSGLGLVAPAAQAGVGPWTGHTAASTLPVAVANAPARVPSVPASSHPVSLSPKGAWEGRAASETTAPAPQQGWTFRVDVWAGDDDPFTGPFGRSPNKQQPTPLPPARGCRARALRRRRAGGRFRPARCGERGQPRRHGHPRACWSGSPGRASAGARRGCWELSPCPLRELAPRLRPGVG